MALDESQIAEMNETDVRENVIKPFLLNRLGYTFEGPARVRTEIPLRYSKIYLGRKKASDPDLRGKSDYICEVVSYGRWVIEAKAGGETLTRDDAEQAHTYAAHPEVAAFYYLVTNGRDYRLYTNRPETPTMEWTFGEMDTKWSIIENVLGPHAIRRRALIYSIDTGKPLARGYGSRVKIVGGFLTYDEYSTPSQELKAQLEKMQGMRGAFVGREVSRTADGMIKASVEIRGPYKEWDDMNRAAGINGYEFQSAVEFISTDAAKPTIFQGITYGLIKTGQESRFPGQPMQRMPLGIKMTATVEATGYLDGTKFQGVFRIGYQYELDPDQPVDLTLIQEPNLSQINQLLKTQPREEVEALVKFYAEVNIRTQMMESMGTFEMNIQEIGAR